MTTPKGICYLDYENLLGVSKDDTVAIGDGANDLSMFKYASTKIAFCAKPILKEASTDTIDSKRFKRSFRYCKIDRDKLFNIGFNMDIFQAIDYWNSGGLYRVSPNLLNRTYDSSKPLLGVEQSDIVKAYEVIIRIFGNFSCAFLYKVRPMKR